MPLTAENLIEVSPSTPPRGFRVDWKLDVGHLISFAVLAIGFAVQYGNLSARVSAIEAHSSGQTAAIERLATAVQSLEGAIIKVQTQLDERRGPVISQRR